MISWIRWSLLAALCASAVACMPAPDGQPEPPPPGEHPDDPGSAEPEPAPDAEPEPAPVPEPEPAPEPPPIEVPEAPGVALRWGRSSLLLTIAVAEDRSGATLEIELFDRDDASQGVLSGDPGFYPVADTRRMWWPLSARPARAAVRLIDGDRLVESWHAVDIDDVPVAELDCDPTGFASRCGGAALCLADGSVHTVGPGYGGLLPREPVGGRCVPAEVTAWHVDEAVLLDISAPAGAPRGVADVGALALDGFSSMAPYVQQTDGAWRGTGYLRDPLPERLEVYVGPHLYATGLTIGAVEDRRVGDPCDRLRLTDRCVAGSACGPEGRCRTIEAPQLDAIEAVAGDDGVVAITFAGVDAQADVDALHLDLLTAAGDLIHREELRLDWMMRPNPSFELAYVPHLAQADGRVEGFVSYRRSGLARPPGRVRVALRDAEGLVGDTVEAPIGQRAPVEVALGAPCDPFEVLTRCPGATICERPDGETGSMTCRTPPAACPVELPTLVDRYDGDNRSAPDHTEASCTWSRGNIGAEQGHVFTARVGGTHVFRAVGEMPNSANTLFVRRHCDLAWVGTSELSCAHQRDDPEGPPTVAVDLPAGETVYVFVEAWWAGGGAYTLTVEPPR